MNGRAAAPPAIACSVGPSTSTKPSAGQRVADRLHDLRPPQEPLQHALGVDQVEIPHPLPQLGIGQALDASPAAARSTWSGSAASRRRSSARPSWCASARRRRRRCRPGRSTRPAPSSPRPPGFLPMNTWICPVQSRMSRKISLPVLRCSTMRPAARTFGPCCVGLALVGARRDRLDRDLALAGADLADRHDGRRSGRPRGRCPAPGSCAASRAATPRACRAYRAEVHGAVHRAALRRTARVGRLIVVLHFAERIATF